MIDFHCHVLPGLDDGPQSMEESLELCRIAEADGIGVIVATPHDRNGIFHNTPTKIQNSVDRLQERIELSHINIKILPGAEVYVDPALPQLVSSGKVMSINENGRVVLVEFPSRFSSKHVVQLVSICVEKNIIPVLAHPERCISFQSEELLSKITKMGGKLQITALSLTGGFGKEIQSFSEKIVKAKLVSIIASDGHWLTNRSPLLSAARNHAAGLIGEDEANKLVLDNPKELINLSSS